MNCAHVRFYAELNDFLKPEQRFRDAPFAFAKTSVKDAIESFGVPHTEVDLILANGESVDFSYLLRDGDRVSVYPVFEALDISSVERVRPQPLRVTRFVLDVHLGALAGYLRMLGFDTLWHNDSADEELARVSSAERRILLTRDRGLLKRGEVTHGYLVRSAAARQQVEEVLYRFDLWDSLRPFSRCLRCNGALRLVAKEAVTDRLPPRTAEYYDEFQECPACGRIYWKGSHFRRMSAFTNYLQSAAKRPPRPPHLKK